MLRNRGTSKNDWHYIFDVFDLRALLIIICKPIEVFTMKEIKQSRPSSLAHFPGLFHNTLHQRNSFDNHPPLSISGFRKIFRPSQLRNKRLPRNLRFPSGSLCSYRKSWRRDLSPIRTLALGIMFPNFKSLEPGVQCIFLS